MAVLYDEKQHSRLDGLNALQVNSWAVVETILVHGE